jgi:Tfp pilus assembly protein PilV
MKRYILQSQFGLTIIEILIASIIFMIGFSTLIILMNSSLVKFSAREMMQADQLADEMMARTLTERDTTSFDTIISRSDVVYLVEKRATVAGKLAEVSLTVSRESQNRKIVELYDALVLR